MQIIDDGIRLNAKLDMPKGNMGKCPLVIVIHGFTGHMEERHITAVSGLFNQMGLATLRVDMYGHGNSDGKFENHTLYKWINNAIAVIDYARSLHFVTDIYLCGHSQGGLTVMLAAALKHESIKGLIPLSPAIMIPEGARKGDLLGMHFNPEEIPDRVLLEHNGMELNGNYVRVAQTIDVDAAIKRYTGPVLIVHGDQDEAVPIQFSMDAAKQYKDATLSVIKGDTHCYDNHLDLVLEAVRNWMRKQIS